MQLAEETPIACTLDATTMAERLRRIKALTATSLISHDLRGGQLRLVYRLGAADEERAMVERSAAAAPFSIFDVQEIGRSVVLIDLGAGSGSRRGGLALRAVPARQRRAGREAIRWLCK